MEKKYVIKNILSNKDFFVLSVHCILLNPIYLTVNLICSIVMSYYINCIFGDIINWNNFFISALVIFIIMFIAEIIQFFINSKKFKKWHEGKLGYKSIEINEEGFKQNYSTAEGIIPWQDFKKIKKIESYYFIETPAHGAFFLAKRFLSEEANTFFNEIIDKYSLTVTLKKRKNATLKKITKEELSGYDIVIKQELKDYLRFNYFHLLKRKKGIIFGYPLIIVYLLSILFLTNYFNSLSFILVIGMMALLYLFILTYPLAYMKKIIATLSFVGYRFTDDAIESKNQYGESVLKWVDIQRAFISRNYYFLYVFKNRAFILPKSVLTEEQKKTLDEIISKFQLKKNIKKRKK